VIVFSMAPRPPETWAIWLAILKSEDSRISNVRHSVAVY
jgi:hypothetical protein